jgi:L-lactate utilization protein LutC
VSTQTGHELERETGDRGAFLARLRGRLAAGAPADIAHPLPPPLTSVPVVRSSLLDPSDVLASFVANATTARAVVHRVDSDDVPADLLERIVAGLNARRAVVTVEEDAQRLVEPLTAVGVSVAPLSIEAAAEADLGVTSAVAAIATTGTLVVSTAAAGGRTASLLPPAHLCVLPASRVVASSEEVLRPLSASTAAAMPSNLVLITGPSRSGDIEQIIALGVHGPIRVEIVLLERC